MRNDVQLVRAERTVEGRKFDTRDVAQRTQHNLPVQFVRACDYVLLLQLGAFFIPCMFAGALCPAHRLGPSSLRSASTCLKGIRNAANPAR